VFARLEVPTLNRLLRRLDALGNHLRLNGHALFHSKALHQGLDLIAGEDAHQIVFERQEEAGGPRIALTSSATAKLIVDAA
jgi:hypothetical protein